MNCGPTGPPQPGTGRSSWSCGGQGRPTTVLKNVVNVKQIVTPTEVDHYQIQRAIDIYVTPQSEDLGRVTDAVRDILKKTDIPGNVRVNLRGMVQGMEASFKSFALGFLISFLLLFLILTAQFKSFVDPFLIMLAIPMGFVGVLIILPLTHSTLNVMSLMGVLMLVGIADSNSILIVDFAHNLEREGLSPADAVITACRVRLRPILMTSLATIIGMIPMALKLGTGAEQYTPMARAIIGGLTSSVLLTIFIVPAAYLLVYGKRGAKRHRNPSFGDDGMIGRRLLREIHKALPISLALVMPVCSAAQASSAAQTALEFAVGANASATGLATGNVSATYAAGFARNFDSSRTASPSG